MSGVNKARVAAVALAVSLSAAALHATADPVLADAPPAALERMETAFLRSSELELAFWESSWQAGLATE